MLQRGKKDVHCNVDMREKPQTERRWNLSSEERKQNCTHCT